MDQYLSDNIKVVVRSVGERTEAACIAAICAQGIAFDQIEVVNESPFSNALRSSFEVGLNSKCEWTLCVDADVVLRPNSISALIAHARRLPEKTCELQGLMFDKFTLSIRAGGIHLYRTEFLDRAIRKIPPADAAIRPETHVLHEMAREGYPWITVPYVIGIHDFGQFFEDIFRKCYVHAHKHLIHLPVLLPLWRKSAEYDSDFEVAIEGLVQGLRVRSAIHIDKRLTPVSYAFSQLDLAEKGAAALEEFSPIAVERMLKKSAVDDVPVHGFRATAREAIEFGAGTRITPAYLMLRSIRRSSGEIGVLRTVLLAIGSGIERLGLFLKKLSARRKARL